MKVLDACFFLNGILPESKNFIISRSFVKELKRCIKHELELIFENKLNMDKVYLRFTDIDKTLGCSKSKESLMLKYSEAKKNESYADRFVIGYNKAYSHYPKLIVENLISDTPILDPTAEVEPNSLKMRLEFDEWDFKSLQECAEREEKIKNGTKLDGYRFEVWVKNLNVDSIFNISFINFPETAEYFIDYFGEIISEYNRNTELGTHTKILVTPDSTKFEKQIFDGEAVSNYFKMVYMYEVFKDTDKAEDILKDVAKAVELQKNAIEEYNLNLEEIPKPYYISQSGLIHSYDVKKEDLKNKMMVLKVDLGSSSHGFEHILNSLNESSYDILKIEVKG